MRNPKPILQADLEQHVLEILDSSTVEVDRYRRTNESNGAKAFVTFSRPGLLPMVVRILLTDNEHALMCDREILEYARTRQVEILLEQAMFFDLLTKL